MSAEVGVEHLSDRALASADRSWTGNDDSARQHHARLPLRARPFTLALSWRESANATVRVIGTFRIHLDVLLAHGLVRMDGPDHVRLRFVHARSGSYLLQANQDRPSVIVAATAGKERAAESPPPAPATRRRAAPPAPPVPSVPSVPVVGVRARLESFGFDGTAALEHALAHSPYGSLESAIASLSLFTHPDTVRQAGARALFRIIRARGADRGTLAQHADGNRVLMDDNTGPTDAFVWANGLRRGDLSDLQFCHVWQASSDPDAYTNLANLCLLPAFLAKLSDTHPRITALLRWRAEEFYGWRPVNERATPRPVGIDGLEWADPLPSVGDLESALRAAMRTKPKSRTTISAREIGWVFSGYRPDPALTAAEP